MRTRVTCGLSVVFLLLDVVPLAGCANQLFLQARPRVEPPAVRVALKEKWPIRAALLVTEEDHNKTYRFSQRVFLASLTTELALGSAMQDAVLLSLAPQFERLTLVRTPPAPGRFQVVLIPKLDHVSLEIKTRFADHEVLVALDASLAELDEAGAELAKLKAEGRGSTVGRLNHGADVDRYAGPLISQAIADVVRRWGEQLALSPQVEQYVSRLRPTVAAQVGAIPDRPPVAEITISFSHPPDGARVSDEAITLVGLVSAAKGVQRIDLVVNDRPVPVSRDVRAQSTDVQNHPFTAQVQRRPGENLIALTAVDAGGGAAQAVRAVFREAKQSEGRPTATAKLGTGERWAVVIGIDRYRDPSITELQYAAADANAFYEFLITKGGVKPNNARLLLNKDATQVNIRRALGDFLKQKALKEDEVIIYYAGHGTTDPEPTAEGGLTKYLVPWDADPTSLFATGIPMEEIDHIFARLAARKILLVQDTCFSGGAGGRTFLRRGLTRATSLTDKFLQDLASRQGRMVLTASDANQLSLESPKLGHGLFTHYLLQALGGAADLDSDGAITTREAHLYLQRKVHEHSGGNQTPQLYSIGDMVIVRVN